MNMTKKSNQTFWAIQTHVKSDNKKYLAWNFGKSKNLYWTSDKKSFVPLIFTTKAEAKKAIKKNDKSNDKIPSKLFTTVDDTAGYGKPVKVKIQIVK